MKRSSMDKKYLSSNTKILLIFFSLGILVLLTAYAPLIGVFLSHPQNRIEFDSVSWKNEDSNWENPVRLNMVDDLLSKYKPVGKSKNQIHELLGIPKPTGYFKEYDYVYWLGPERSFVSIDSEWLVIKFQDNIVTEAKVLSD